MNVDDIIEATNHFRCIDLIIDRAEEKITESLIKELHYILKSGTSDSCKNWFAVGNYKRLPNEVGGIETCPPEKCLANNYVPFIITEELNTISQTHLKTFFLFLS